MKCWMTVDCRNDATHGFYTPAGQLVGSYCKPHCEEAKKEYQEKLGEQWIGVSEAQPYEVI